MEKQDLDRELREAIPWMLWEIWKARNSSMYAAKTNSPHFVVATVLEEAKEWLQQNALSQQGHSQRNQRQAMDCRAAIDALATPEKYPKYRFQIIKIQQVIRVMRETKFVDGVSTVQRTW
ncbi:hypothetical protein ARALYDRAFT_358442 [Arabidopsis lyrata subsp. lyrata]|uniref:Uncharacterized protein n=1 Tax=Arabidopsis lyrata subsp. lyrata TaxID=81972 RepID=D7MLW4_ARALL|nr:hypothetical protein ARALYDRAFT_358442 [Arabidopsis lyrata subsp. lyrata]